MTGGSQSGAGVGETIILDKEGMIVFSDGRAVRVLASRLWLYVGCHKISWEAFDKLKQLSE